MKNETGMIFAERFLRHDTGPNHPERPARLESITTKLRETGMWERFTHLGFEPADLSWIRRLHEPSYVARCFAACESGERTIDSADTVIGPESAEIAQLAVGGVLAAVDAVMAGRVNNAICLVRPPGHHAEADRAMGFCLFNNIAIAAEYLAVQHGLDRVAVLDFDVHHGNGTQHLFEHRRDVLFISLHQHPATLYPGTGYVHETGRGEGEGFTLNLPLDPGSDDDVYRHAMVFKVLPALKAFQPQFLLLSAGFDAAKDDPLAQMNVTPSGYEWMTRFLKTQAQTLCEGRLVSVIEGGYDLRCLAESVLLHAGVLLEPAESNDMMAVKSGFF